MPDAFDASVDPLDIACIKCGARVTLTLSQTLKSAGVWKGTCAVCGVIYSRQEPMAKAKAGTPNGV
jgi:prepilin signal peptidase PulO-like enzyme (type II secretory pathway)